MKTWNVKAKIPKLGLCEVREMTDKETTAANNKKIYYGARSQGFVNLFQNNKFVGWCGVAFAKRKIFNPDNIKLQKFIRDIPV